MKVNIHEAKTHFSRLLERVAGRRDHYRQGGDSGRQASIPERDTKKRVFGSAKGEFTVPDDFNDADPEIEELFYNGPLLPTSIQFK